MTPEIQRFYAAAAARLAVLRLYLGHDPKSFAAMLDMTPRAYSAYERGKRSQSAAWIRVALAASEKTGVTLDWLFSGEWPHPGSGNRNDHRPVFRYGANRRPALRVVNGTA